MVTSLCVKADVLQVEESTPLQAIKSAFQQLDDRWPLPRSLETSKDVTSAHEWWGLRCRDDLSILKCIELLPNAPDLLGRGQQFFQGSYKPKGLEVVDRAALASPHDQANKIVWPVWYQPEQDSGKGTGALLSYVVARIFLQCCKLWVWCCVCCVVSNSDLRALHVASTSYATLLHQHLPDSKCHCSASFCMSPSFYTPHKLNCGSNVNHEYSIHLCGKHILGQQSNTHLPMYCSPIRKGTSSTWQEVQADTRCSFNWDRARNWFCNCSIPAGMYLACS